MRLNLVDPFDQPLINFNSLDTGTWEGNVDQLDVDALVQALKISRGALEKYYNYEILGGIAFLEQEPSSNVTSDEE